MSTYEYTIHYMDNHRLAKKGMFKYDTAKGLAENISLYYERSVILKRHTPLWYNDCATWTDDYWVNGVHCSEFNQICDTCKKPWDSEKIYSDPRFCKCHLARQTI